MKARFGVARRPRRQRARAALRREVHDQPRHRPRHRARGRARSSRASSPTWCCGTRASSASGPQVVIKGGALVWGALGDPNASIPTPQPVLMRPDARGRGRRRPRGDLRVARPRSTTGSPSGSACGGGWWRITPTRDIGKADMVNNDALPDDRHRPRDLRDHRRGRARRRPRRPPSCRWPSSTRCSDGVLVADCSCCWPTRGCLSPATPSRRGLEPALAAGLDDVRGLPRAAPARPSPGPRRPPPS